MGGKLDCDKTSTVTARVRLSDNQAMLDFIRNSDSTRFQLIFNFASKLFSVSYYDGTSWNARELESW